MRIQDEFEVRAPIAQVWDHLLDVERVAGCMPGAELTDVVDERTWKGRINVKLGPVGMSFAGTVVLEERDEDARRVALRANGREERGRGSASAVVTSRLDVIEGGTKVSFETDLTVTGAAAQYGRGMLADISKRLTREFAECLERDLTAVASTADIAKEIQLEREVAPGGSEVHTGELAGPGESGEGSPATANHSAEARGDSGLHGRSSAERRPPPKSARPVAGFRLAVWALWRALGRFVRGLFRGGDRGSAG
jgi:uncharacterized protein